MQRFPSEACLTTCWSWRVPAMQEALRLLHEERELQADGVRNMDEWVILNESEERVGDEERGERGHFAPAARARTQ